MQPSLRQPSQPRALTPSEVARCASCVVHITVWIERFELLAPWLHLISRSVERPRGGPNEKLCRLFWNLDYTCFCCSYQPRAPAYFVVQRSTSMLSSTQPGYPAARNSRCASSLPVITVPRSCRCPSRLSASFRAWRRPGNCVTQP